jgi:hypothetical protein
MLEPTPSDPGPICLLDGSVKDMEISKAAGRVIAYDLDFETPDHHRCVMVTMRVINPRGAEFVKLFDSGTSFYLSPTGLGFVPDDGSFGDTHFFSWFNMTTSSPFKCATKLDRKALRTAKAG